MRRALVADDERLDREGLIRQVRWADFGIGEVLSAKNGREALAILEKTPVDLLLTDISMPGMDGLELVREVRAKNASMRIVLISGYDDFEYAQRAISLGVSAYILKPVETEKLEEALKKALSEISARDRDEGERESLRQRAEQADFLSESDRVAAFLLKTGRPGDGGIWKRLGSGAKAVAVLSADDAEQILSDISVEEGQAKVDSLTDCVRRFAEAENAVAARMTSSRFACVFRAEGDLSRIENRLCELSRQVEEACGFAVTALLSEPQTEDALLPDTYRECCRLLMKKVFAGQGVVLRQKGGAIGRELSADELLSRVREEVSSSVRDFDAKRLSDFTHSLFHEMRDDRAFPLARVRNLAVYFAGSIQYAMTENGLSAEETNDMLFFERVMRCENFDALAATAREYVDMVGRALTEGGERHQQHMGKLLVAYIDEHYGENISLKTIAPRFFYTPNHLGVLFKRATGMSFYDYLTRRRMRVAAELLKDPTLYIYEVARRVSFKNTNSFSAQFRRFYGVNPTEYIQRARGESDCE